MQCHNIQCRIENERAEMIDQFESSNSRPAQGQDFVFPDKNDSYLERLAYLCDPQQIVPDGAYEWTGSAAARPGGKWKKGLF